MLIVLLQGCDKGSDLPEAPRTPSITIVSDEQIEEFKKEFLYAAGLAKDYGWIKTEPRLPTNVDSLIHSGLFICNQLVTTKGDVQTALDDHINPSMDDSSANWGMTLVLMLSASASLCKKFEKKVDRWVFKNFPKEKQ